jgi:hypothetical protein
MLLILRLLASDDIFAKHNLLILTDSSIISSRSAGWELRRDEDVNIDSRGRKVKTSHEKNSQRKVRHRSRISIVECASEQLLRIRPKKQGMKMK